MADTKDWTWVLERRGPECGFEAALVGRYDLQDPTVVSVELGASASIHRWACGAWVVAARLSWIGGRSR